MGQERPRPHEVAKLEEKSLYKRVPGMSSVCSLDNHEQTPAAGAAVGQRGTPPLGTWFSAGRQAVGRELVSASELPSVVGPMQMPLCL